MWSCEHGPRSDELLRVANSTIECPRNKQGIRSGGLCTGTGPALRTMFKKILKFSSSDRGGIGGELSVKLML